MLKRILIFLLFFAIQPIYSSELNDTYNSSQKLFVYLYTDNCGYCVKFNPIYNKLENFYNSKCEFLKINANTEAGQKMMRDLNAYYVPYVVLIDNNKQSLQRLSPQCLLNYACIKDSMNKFVH